MGGAWKPRINLKRASPLEYDPRTDGSTPEVPVAAKQAMAEKTCFAAASSVDRPFVPEKDEDRKERQGAEPGPWDTPDSMVRTS